VYDDDIIAAPGTPTPAVDPDAYKTPSPRVMSDDEADAADLEKKQAASGSTPTSERLMRERAATAKSRQTEDSINKAKEGQDALDLAQAESAQKAIQDKQLQDQLQAAEGAYGVPPPTQAEEIAYRSPGPTEAELEEQGMAGNMMDGTAYTQSPDGAPPGQSKDVPKEKPEGGQPTGKSNSFWGGVSSKLSAAGTAVYGAGEKIATSVIDGAKNQARQVSESIDKATGMTKNLGESIKTTVTPTPTVEEAKKAEVIPTTTEAEKKAEAEPEVAADQKSQQGYHSEVAQENQRYQALMVEQARASINMDRLYKAGRIDKQTYLDGKDLIDNNAPEVFKKEHFDNMDKINSKHGM